MGGGIYCLISILIFNFFPDLVIERVDWLPLPTLAVYKFFLFFAVVLLFIGIIFFFVEKDKKGDKQIQVKKVL
ncbi:hypothetical protein DSAG12_04645 [Promethearchaeum syntrophicum]|uniref:Uncharacterized protein n=1 Tax=Promethearchaeum syntrophicum TaxID=2594042 RepID=A0AC61ZU64_9ARCH|nr:hypothetical protein [Candidatus Prometheoarchaeum syntrophicum]